MNALSHYAIGPTVPTQTAMHQQRAYDGQLQPQRHALTLIDEGDDFSVFTLGLDELRALGDYIDAYLAKWQAERG